MAFIGSKCDHTGHVAGATAYHSVVLRLTLTAYLKALDLDYNRGHQHIDRERHVSKQPRKTVNEQLCEAVFHTGETACKT